MRRDGAATICVRIVCDNAVLQRRCAVVKDTASRISANGAVIHCQVPRTIDDGATRSAAHSGTAISAIPGDGDFGTLIWPHFGRLMWPHLIYSDRSSYPVPASRDGRAMDRRRKVELFEQISRE